MAIKTKKSVTTRTKSKKKNDIPVHKWTDVIANIALDNFFDAIEENRRLVDTGLYTRGEFQELCDFTHTFWCDYSFSSSDICMLPLSAVSVA